MLNDIEAGNGASKTFTDMDKLIKGLSVLISTNAGVFGVMLQDLESHQNTAKKKICDTSPSTPINPPKTPTKSEEQISLFDDGVVKSDDDGVDVDVQETVNDGKTNVVDKDEDDKEPLVSDQ